MMLKIRIREVALEKGIRTSYQLKKRAKLAPTTAVRCFNNQVKHLTIETLSKICEALDCEVSDLLVKTTSNS
ncbi:MAG TPA: helix-turn-helix transcriptional regulator [Pyrinomonadaceae bacterium]